MRRIPGSHFTEHLLDGPRPFQTLEVESLLGNFGIHAAKSRPLPMVASGAGLMPINCLLEALLDDLACPSVWLSWAMRAATDVCAHEVIHSYADRFFEFESVPVPSRPDDDRKCRCGRLQGAPLEDLPDLSEGFICLRGSPNMITDAQTTFQAHEAEIEHVHADNFSLQRPVAYLGAARHTKTLGVTPIDRATKEGRACRR